MKESQKHIRRQEIFYMLRNTISFDKTIEEGDRFSAVSAYIDSINDKDNGISFAIDTENNFVEFILTYDEAKVLKEAVTYMLEKINKEN